VKKGSFLKKLAITGMFMLSLITAAQANPINLALTGTATQSSTYPQSQWSNHNPGIAIDGITDGNAYLGQITHTLEEFQAWWQVDLLDTYQLDQIVLWNRTDCCAQRLSNFNVSVLDNQHNTVWTNDFFTNGGYPNTSFAIDLPDNILGEIVKVRLNGADYLSLAEVQVFAAPEPGTMILLGSGLIGLVGLRRRLKK
jgi:hypothetical protein